MNTIAFVRHHSSSIRLASLQFLSLAAVGMVAPFINLYLVEADFSATLIGTLASVGAILALVITPMLNRFADQRLLHRRLFMSYLFGFAIANMLFATTNTQVTLIIAVLLVAVTVSPSLTLGMQLTMTQIATRSKAMLGQVRSFAAMGFSVASLLAGQLFGVGGYSLLFLVGAIFAILTIQLATIFPPKPKLKEKQLQEARVPRRRGFYVLIASQFFAMMGIQNSFAFMFIHFTQNLGIATADIGIWAALLAGMEIPFFVLADKILPKIQSRFAYAIGILGIAIYICLLGARSYPCSEFSGARFVDFIPGFDLALTTLVCVCNRVGSQSSAQALACFGRHESGNLTSDDAQCCFITHWFSLWMGV